MVYILFVTSLLVITVCLNAFSSSSFASMSKITNRQIQMGPINTIQNLFRKSAVDGNSHYDYIIVGGGTAGSLLANRLSSNENKKILVLEAGSPNYKNKYISIPAGVLRLFKTKYDWNFESTPEPNVNNREIYLCRGKVLGGSSCINVMLYNRGDSTDYNKWAELSGSKDWAPENVLDYFKKSEDHFFGIESKYHGIKGEVAISQVPYQNPLSKTFLDGCDEIGIHANNDFNDWSTSQEGYGRFHVFQKNGRRVSAVSAFLKPAMKRKNLKVVTDACVSKVNVENSLARGVTFIKDGKTYEVKLSEGGEVLLTGGSINSPQVLLLSGIGPKEQLSQHGIQTIVDLPGVGKNLQDHPATVVSYACAPGNEGLSTSSKLRLMKGSAIPNPKVFLQWLIRGNGPLTTTGCDHGAYVKTLSNLESPDLQLRFVAARAITPDGMSTLSQFKKVNNLEDGFSFQSLVSRPKSVGSVELKTTNPFDKPMIKTGYFTHPEDLAVMRTGIRLSRKIAQSSVFDKYRGEEIYPGSHIQTNDDLDNYIRNTVHTANALVGTCKMGTDSMSVVDSNLRVYGVKGLRVIDSSVMPKLPGGQGGAATIMIAEKGAEMLIKQ